MAARVPGDTSVDAHHAGNAVTDRTNGPGASGSVDAHHAADDFTDTTLALMSYNICIQNPEPHSGKNCTNSAVAFGIGTENEERKEKQNENSAFWEMMIVREELQKRRREAREDMELANRQRSTRHPLVTAMMSVLEEGSSRWSVYNVLTWYVIVADSGGERIYEARYSDQAMIRDLEVNTAIELRKTKPEECGNKELKLVFTMNEGGKPIILPHFRAMANYFKKGKDNFVNVVWAAEGERHARSMNKWECLQCKRARGYGKPYLMNKSPFPKDAKDGEGNQANDHLFSIFHQKSVRMLITNREEEDAELRKLALEMGEEDDRSKSGSELLAEACEKRQIDATQALPLMRPQIFINKRAALQQSDDEDDQMAIEEEVEQILSTRTTRSRKTTSMPTTRMHERATCPRIAKTPNSDGQHLAGIMGAVPGLTSVPGGKSSRSETRRDQCRSCE